MDFRQLTFLKLLYVATNLQITNKKSTIPPSTFSLKLLTYVEIISPKAKFHAGGACSSLHFACINPRSYESYSSRLYAPDWHQSHFPQVWTNLRWRFGLWELPCSTAWAYALGEGLKVYLEWQPWQNVWTTILERLHSLFKSMHLERGNIVLWQHHPVCCYS